jgi:hypothetical protein
VMAAEQQLRTMAHRHHATMKKLDGLREAWGSRKDRVVSTLETGLGAWSAGLVRGRTEGTRDPVARFATHPLALGTMVLALGYFDFGGARWSDDLIHFGNGYVSSYLAAKGFATGARLRAEKQG